MSLSKRIAFSLIIILLFFLCSILVFSWSNGVRKEIVVQLQSVTRSQFMINSHIQQLRKIHKKLLVIEALAETRNQSTLTDQERADLLESITRQKARLVKISQRVDPDLLKKMQGTKESEHLLNRWQEAIVIGKEKTATEEHKPIRSYRSDFNVAVDALKSDTELLTDKSQALNTEIDKVESLTNRVTLIVFLSSLIFTIALAYHLFHYTKRALSALLEGTDKWSHGHLEYQIPKFSNDELGGLAEAFNGMAATLQSTMKKVEEEKQRADEANLAKSSFLANMSHELRTPMNAIIGYSEMLMEEIEEDDDIEVQDLQPDLAKILEAGKHLLSLINDVLDISKIESGKMTLYFERINLKSSVEEVLHTVHPLAEKQNNQIKFNFEAENAEFNTDVTKFRQILLNLLSNACKFTSDGVIEITLARTQTESEDTLNLSVIDNGIGMTEEQLGRIFDEFTQADSSTTRQFGGTGLGLSICKKFALLMHGDITVKSTPGAGTCFTFTCPNQSLAQSDSKEGQQLSGQTETISKGSACILVIDDDATSRELAKRILSKKNYSVITAESGKKGIELAKEYNPEIIVLDVLMPEMDGWQVLEQLKQDPDTSAIPVIMQSMLSERELGLSLGASDYLIKPIDKEKLTKTVKSFLPERSAGKLLLVTEDASALGEAIKEALTESEWDIIRTADLDKAELLIKEDEIKLILIGEHSDPNGVALFMEGAKRSDANKETPLLLVNSEANEDYLADQLTRFFEEHNIPD